MIFRSLAPSGVPFSPADLLAGFKGALHPEKSLRIFRNRLSGKTGQRSVFLFSSGRGALSAALQVLHSIHPERNEVLIPAYTSFSVPSAVVNAGLKVRLYDLNPDTLSPDEQSLRSAVSERSLCIVVCHLFGYVADMDAVLDIAGNLPIIDDAAQSLGAEYKGMKAGTLGDIGLYSMSRGKNISAVDGGILVTGKPEIAEALSSLEYPFASLKQRFKIIIMAFILCLLLHPRLYWIPRKMPFLDLGRSVFDPDFNCSGLTGFQAGLGMRMLDKLEKITEGRIGTARAYMKRITRAVFPVVVEGATSVYLRLPVLSAGNSAAAPEWGVVGSYPTSIGRIKELKGHIAGGTVFAGADKLAAGIITLPTHAYVSDDDVDEISTYINLLEN